MLEQRRNQTAVGPEMTDQRPPTAKLHAEHRRRRQVARPWNTAWHGKPGDGRARGGHRADAASPCGYRHERALRCSTDQRSHEAVDARQRVEFQTRSQVEGERHFVEHDPHAVAATRAQPETKRDIGGFPAERMWDVLNEETVRRSSAIETG